MDSYKIALPLFEGPLELLLHLIKQNKIDIYDIPIALITKQYLDYLEFMKELDLEIASEFLVMAATLIYIKSCMLLPKNEQTMEEDPRQELVEQLIEYQKFKEASLTLKERYQVWSLAFPRKTCKENEFLVQEINIFDLFTALKRILDRPEPKIYMPEETIKIEDKIKQILNTLQKRKTLNFEELFLPGTSKLEIIITFLALLELLKLKAVQAFQEKPFDKIKIILMEEDYGNRNYF
jgi:segregation and condensation protein A